MLEADVTILNILLRVEKHNSFSRLHKPARRLRGWFRELMDGKCYIRSNAGIGMREGVCKHLKPCQYASIEHRSFTGNGISNATTTQHWLGWRGNSGHFHSNAQRCVLISSHLRSFRQRGAWWSTQNWLAFHLFGRLYENLIRSGSLLTTTGYAVLSLAVWRTVPWGSGRSVQPLDHPHAHTKLIRRSRTKWCDAGETETGGLCW